MVIIKAWKNNLILGESKNFISDEIPIKKIKRVNKYTK